MREMTENTVLSGRTVAVVIVAAGRGERAGQSQEGPKQYRNIGGASVLYRTLEAFASHPSVSVIAVAIHPDDRVLFEDAAHNFLDRVICVHGGATRQDSTRLALQALAEKCPSTVIIHDGVRPFVDAGLIDRVVATAATGCGALPALPVTDTLKREAPDGTIKETVARSGLHVAQTPQGFPFPHILDAHQKAFEAGRSDFTDDAAIAEWAGMAVRIVPGSPDNVKLTWARDIAMAHERLSPRATFPDVRTGNGYDVHSFEPGDHVVLCGVAIPHDKKLSGHSDADVGLHALTDALLATCGEGDIGTHFPPSDPQWKGAASHIFVEHAAKIVRAKGGRIANADITIISEAPRIGPHRAAMTEALSSMLGISADRVSVKATTNEKLGFIGRSEGIAAIATASVVYPGELPE
ncbi:bifunctional 2-C-methyl-D-erythritol 4-phosphate cytidylyltransferase/2-C-methyl-D-erythritol 2,4-cyclodiphosphate synthase [Mesorhizobium sp. NBSH29]|uniref:bifunctional 2-C-methyl-D-erythritol 4-phosphate cytidylyltransferase/2-C-methyl-D-erythritol 2,4-cyclodiphosphate synthase n=1 Tax=Mesorhizobium sp. NBSH29 TaxID=2654249 RepID=UPI001896748E|nr:bifunctional 2-C-methyl-D-erythritol 4-phosphate cytidylyltransferase/2-C-methyl-D-erythritol 2,4-cyclodiphosphate synthase [Mesorhizobium sp. NBSH29]QPC87756.1 bifunctional 2-C-methyl-D-erythritol 4-phosphate cytidylyltransferase/2-C-methyl-D-erythritol 2,4-cyclodiphosphate synthase [Mesorhizobium sp. NBSH29]